MSEVRVFRGPQRAFEADATVPGDKSLSHRALILAAMAAGTSRITGLGPGADVLATLRVLRDIGVEVDTGGEVVSPGVEGWCAPIDPLDAGNSGTTMRLMAGALGGRPFVSELIGDSSLMQRPMRRLVAPLAALGVDVGTAPDGRPPLTVRGGRLRGAEVVVPVASAQVRSAVALAALQATGPTVLDSPRGFRDHTERALSAAGRGRWLSDTAFLIHPGPIAPGERSVPGDPSSAAFLLASAALRPGARVRVSGISLNPGRSGFLEVLEHMGATVEIVVTHEGGGEPVGNVTVTGARLHGTSIAGELTVRCLDELPLLAVLAGVAEGPTRVADAAELRVKESDRIATIASLIRALGGEITTESDGFRISGGARYRPCRIDAAGDHRIVMSAAVAATAAGEVEVEGASTADVSWPGFAEDLEAVWSSP